jgi:hypothetical protein
VAFTDGTGTHRILADSGLGASTILHDRPPAGPQTATQASPAADSPPPVMTVPDGAAAAATTPSPAPVPAPAITIVRTAPAPGGAAVQAGGEGQGSARDDHHPAKHHGHHDKE